MKAVEETGFVPNEVARSLFKKSARTIGLVLPNIENPFFIEMASAIENEADRHGYRVLLYNTRGDFEKEKSALQILTSMNADGIIITRSSDRLQPYIEACTIPVVITDTVFSEGKANAYVHCDFYEGGRIATEHLLKCGCRNIVCMKAEQKFYSARARYEGYRDVCRENNMTEKIVDCDYTYGRGLQAAENMLKMYPEADGIVASNDMVAIAALKVLFNKGVSVPGNIKIVGFDDIPAASIISPELTTISQPIDEIGAKAVQLIIDNSWPDDEAGRHVFPVKLVVRQTTAVSE